MLWAQFIKHSAAAIQHPFFFIVRGNCKKGMLHHMGMTPLYYSTLLMAAGLIRFKGSTVCFQRDECSDSFFGSSQYGLLGPYGMHGMNGIRRQSERFE